MFNRWASVAIAFVIDQDPAVNWLLESEDPSIIYLTRKEILGEDDSELVQIRRKIPSGPKVRALLSGQRPDGGFGVHPYRKWTGSHWRLVSLVQLSIPADNKSARKAAREVANWLSRALQKSTSTAGEYPRKHASIYGNALGTLSYLGMAHDRRVRLIAESLINWQWPDGGWNCDPNPSARHSSFYESLSTLWDSRSSIEKLGVDRSRMLWKERLSCSCVTVCSGRTEVKKSRIPSG